MAKIIDKKNEKLAGESLVYDKLKENLPDDVIVYYNREVNDYEFDFCVLIKNLGLMIIEVKGWTPKHIISVNSPDEIVIANYDKPETSPKKQANGYRFALLNMLNSKYGINPIIVSSVAYPFLSEKDYRKIGLDIVTEPENTFFYEDLNDPQKLSFKMGQIFKQHKVHGSDKTSGIVYDTIRKHFENNLHNTNETNISNYSELRIYNEKITFSNIQEILNSYTAGTKQIVFVYSQDEAVTLIDNLNAYFKDANISYNNGQLNFNSSNKNPLELCGETFSIFNFDIFVLNSHNKPQEDNILIINGNIPDKYNQVLYELSNNSNFNLKQYIIEHAPCDKHIQVRAGAGTGKTYSMISRISYICHAMSNSGVLNPAEEIAMLTFTDDAAINMRNRLKIQFKNYFVLTRDKKYLDMVANVERMRISTIHSFAKEIIRRSSIPLGIGTDFTTVSGNYQRKQILRRHLSQYFEKKVEIDPGFVYRVNISWYDIEKYIINFIEKCYSKGVDLRNITPDMLGEPIPGAEYLKEIIVDVVKKSELEYAQYLIDNNLVALSDYMIYLNKCVLDESFNARLYHYKFIFIDEFQDVDDDQISIFKTMAKKIDFKYFIVGDLKQSIYRFRGATMDAFSKMGCDDEGSWRSYSLNINYRSDIRLLSEYEGMFVSMGNKNLIPYGKTDTITGIKQNSDNIEPLIEKIEFEYSKDSRDELYDKLFDKVKERIKQLETINSQKTLNKASRTIAILVRKNYEVAEILKQGKERGIQVESDKNTNLYALQSTIDLCKLTSALCNPYNPIYLYDLLQSNNIAIDFSPLNLLNKTEEEKLNLIIDCLNMVLQERMGKTWQKLVEEVQQKPVLQVLREIYIATKPWKNYSQNLDKQTYYRINYELIFESLAKSNTKNYLTLESINESLFIAITTGQETKSRDVIQDDMGIRVICVTVHASKGLEYDTVILPYTQNAINEIKKDAVEISTLDNKIGYCFNFRTERYVNNYFDTNNEILEIKKEESRLLYVALTRAINKFIWFSQKDNDKCNWNQLLEGIEKCQ